MERYRSGAWLNRGLVTAIAATAAALFVAMLVWLTLGGQGTLDSAGRPIGTDYSSFWTAGRLALDGHAADAYDWAKHGAAQQALHGRDVIDFYCWAYPPLFLLLAAPLALLPYVSSLLVWQGVSLAAFAATVRLRTREPLHLLVALACPLVFLCLSHGQNALITAALFGSGLMLLDRRPWLAGVALGLLTYKPQFGLVIPVLLLAGGHWRAIGGACLSAAAAALLTLAIWGVGVWEAFAASLPQTKAALIEQGAPGWEKLQSLFAWARMLGAPVPTAYALQAGLTLAAAAAVFALAKARPDLRNAATLIAALLATPFVLDYDLALAILAGLFLFVDGDRHGFAPWEKSLLALVWLAPLAGRAVASATAVPVGLICLLVLFALTIRRAAPFKAGTSPRDCSTCAPAKPNRPC